jgi:hypothetical protein
LERPDTPDTTDTTSMVGVIKMCEREFERLHRMAEQESFNQSILAEIREARLRLERRIVSLRVGGNHYEVGRCERLVAWLDLAEESMRRMLSNQKG